MHIKKELRMVKLLLQIENSYKFYICNFANHYVITKKLNYKDHKLESVYQIYLMLREIIKYTDYIQYIYFFSAILMPI